jgi:hypothetical protein
MRCTLPGLAVAVLLAVAASAINHQDAEAAELYGLTPGTVELQSAGQLAFGPSGVLFVGDAKAAKVYAINTDDKKTDSPVAYEIDDLSAKAAAAYGGKKVSIVDLAVNPETGNAFLSLTAGGQASIAKVTPDGTVTPLNLDKIGNSVATLPNPPEDKEVQGRRGKSNARNSSITDLAYTAGRVLVAGLAAGDSPSSVREFDFPFNESAKGFRVEIYHAAHGKSEDHSPIQTFVPFNIGGEPSLLAGYTCTPLVKIPVTKFGSNSKVQGTTVAELGNHNKPLDMIVYKQHGKDYLLLANSAHGVMKINTDNLDRENGLTERVGGGGVAGQTFETIDSLAGVVQLEKLDDTHALVVIQVENGPMSLKSVDLP